MFFDSPKFKYRLHITIKSAIVASVMGGIYTVLHDLVIYRNQFPTVKTGLIAGFLIGISLMFTEQFIFSQKFKRKPFLATLFIRSITYALVSSFWLILLNGIISDRANSFFDALNVYLQTRFFIDFIFACMAAVLIISLMQINSLHNPGELLKFISGTFHEPQEVERVFMFVDIKSSTTLAEQMGNIPYSRFLQDFFYDITDAIILTKAEIYQYVGDEIILSWPNKKDGKNEQCLHCFYLMKDNIAARKKTYLKRYGFAPEFKAGMHGGSVVVTWVGEIKKEIVYHGDVLNTTARIQAMCNSLSQELVISGDIFRQIKSSSVFKMVHVDTLLLKGKTNEVELYGVQKVAG